MVTSGDVSVRSMVVGTKCRDINGVTDMHRSTPVKQLLESLDLTPYSCKILSTWSLEGVLTAVGREGLLVATLTRLS